MLRALLLDILHHPLQLPTETRHAARSAADAQSPSKPPGHSTPNSLRGRRPAHPPGPVQPTLHRPLPRPRRASLRRQAPALGTHPPTAARGGVASDTAGLGPKIKLKKQTPPLGARISFVLIIPLMVRTHWGGQMRLRLWRQERRFRASPRQYKLPPHPRGANADVRDRQCIIGLLWNPNSPTKAAKRSSRRQNV